MTLNTLLIIGSCVLYIVGIIAAIIAGKVTVKRDLFSENRLLTAEDIASLNHNILMLLGPSVLLFSVAFLVSFSLDGFPLILSQFFAFLLGITVPIAIRYLAAIVFVIEDMGYLFTH